MGIMAFSKIISRKKSLADLENYLINANYEKNGKLFRFSSDLTIGDPESAYDSIIESLSYDLDSWQFSYKSIAKSLKFYDEFDLNYKFGINRIDGKYKIHTDLSDVEYSVEYDFSKNIFSCNTVGAQENPVICSDIKAKCEYVYTLLQDIFTKAKFNENSFK